MTADVATAQETEVEVFEKPSQAALKRIAADFDYSKPLKWLKAEDMSEWYALVAKPPLHSVVIDIGPEMARQILQVANHHNRHLGQFHADKIGRSIKADDYELTGDTIKFDTDGRMLDGQHRLRACEKSGKVIRTHAVFGLHEDVFDVIDQGKKRSAGDILGLCGVEAPNLVAAAVRWVRWYDEGGKRSFDMRDTRQIKKAALGSMKGIGEWIVKARQVNVNFKHPPGIIAGILFVIARENKQIADDFVQAWLNGGRMGRNKTFDVLHQRIATERHRGAMNNEVRAAMIIQAFNHWNAHSVASERSLKWKKEWTFPTVEFDAAKFTARKKAGEEGDTSLKNVQMRILSALIDFCPPNSIEATATKTALAEKSKVPVNQVGDILRTLVEEKSIKVTKQGLGPQPSTYRLVALGE